MSSIDSAPLSVVLKVPTILYRLSWPMRPSLLRKKNKWWCRMLWKWHLPLKLKLFCWLMIENKILTIENYMRRGGMGPNIYLLCCNDVETIVHLMVHCPFTKVVWRELEKVYTFTFEWDYLDL